MKNVKQNVNHKKDGFTLIELLAVIIILGILMIIAIPSVTSYINNSRKSAYVDTAKEIVAGARNLVNEGKLEMYDTNTTYYIPASCISTENSQKSPYGEFDKAYVLVTYDGNGYNYYWVSRDETGQGVPEPIAIADLDEDDIESDISFDYIKEETKKDNTTKILILKADNCNEFDYDIAIYPEGKSKKTVEVGDLVKIGTEEFYVVSNDGTDLVLLAHYNLNVGSNAKGVATGKQDPDVKGYISNGVKYGDLEFSSINYWDGKVGTDYSGSYCSSNTYTTGTKCVYVYDENSNLKTYVEAYKVALEGMGATIKEARLMKVEEAYALGCGNGAWNCNNAPAFVKETSFWLGSAYQTDYGSAIWTIGSGNIFTYAYKHYSNYGIRPIIII